MPIVSRTYTELPAPVADYPAEPVAELDKLKAAFYKAVAAGRDGMKEYMALATRHAEYATAVNAENRRIREQYQDMLDTGNELRKQGRLLDGQRHLVGYDVNAGTSHGSSSVLLRHDYEQAVARWRTDLAKLTGKDESNTAPTGAGTVVPLPAFPASPRVVTPLPRYDVLKAQAVNAALAALSK